MKLDIQGMKKLVKSINEMREETNHLKEKIERVDWETAKWMWRKSKNAQEFKDWMRVELGW